MRLGIHVGRISREEIIERLADGLKRYANGPEGCDSAESFRLSFPLWWESWVKPRYEMIAKLAKKEELSFSDEEFIASMIGW